MLISEVAHKVGLHPETIRRLEKRGAIAPAARDVNGWRRYSPEVVDCLKRLYGQGDGEPRCPVPNKGEGRDDGD